MKTVKDMFNYASSLSLPLLSNYNSPFWHEYVANYNAYDKLFSRRFKSFRYYLQDINDDIDTVTRNFIDEVYEYLLINDKKYSELYRISEINDNDYSLLDNYNTTEIMTRNTLSNDTNVYGSRSDRSEISVGEQSVNSTNTIAGFNSSEFSKDNMNETTNSSRLDSNTLSKGEQTDTSSNTGSENYTLTKRGNIGIQSATDLLTKHENFWRTYRFYEMIFKDISKDLLLV